MKTPDGYSKYTTVNTYFILDENSKKLGEVLIDDDLTNLFSISALELNPDGQCVHTMNPMIRSEYDLRKYLKDNKKKMV